MNAKIRKIAHNGIQLSLLDRIVLQGALPIQGNIKTLTIVRDVNKKIGLTQDEFKKYNIQFSGDATVWNDAGNKAKFTYEFTGLEIVEIKNALKKLSDSGQLHMDALGVCEKFGITE